MTGVGWTASTAYKFGNYCVVCHLKNRSQVSPKSLICNGIHNQVVCNEIHTHLLINRSITVHNQVVCNEIHTHLLINRSITVWRHHFPSDVSPTEFQVQALNFDRIHTPRLANHLIKLLTKYFRVKGQTRRGQKSNLAQVRWTVSTATKFGNCVVIHLKKYHFISQDLSP